MHICGEPWPLEEDRGGSPTCVFMSLNASPALACVVCLGLLFGRSSNAPSVSSRTRGAIFSRALMPEGLVALSSRSLQNTFVFLHTNDDYLQQMIFIQSPTHQSIV